MTVTEARSKAAETVQSALDHVPEVVSSARSGAEQVVEQMPEAIDRARDHGNRTEREAESPVRSVSRSVFTSRAHRVC